jgi:hypothetical protein
LNFIIMFGIITIVTEVAEHGGQVAHEKPIFVNKSRVFKHFGVLMTNKHIFSRLKNPCNPCNPRLKNPIILSNLSSCLRALRGEIIPEISVNSWLIKDLRSTKVYVRKNILFLQNEPNFRKSQVNLTVFITRNYVQMDTWSIRKNEPKTNPIEPKTNPILDNKTPIRTQFKPKQTQFQRKTMSNLTINTRRKSRGSCVSQIQAINACDRPAENHPGRKCRSVVGLSFIGDRIGE